MLEFEGQIKMEEMFLEDGKDSAAGIEFEVITRWEQFMLKSVKVILCLFGMVQ